MPDGAGWFRQGFSDPALLRILTRLTRLRVRGFHPLWRCFPNSFRFAHQPFCQSYNPDPAYQVGLGCSAFARHYSRNHYCFLLLQVLRCFSSLGCLPARAGCTDFIGTGCPIRTSTDHRSFAPPRGFSQLTTSFVVSGSPGIPHTPLFASLPSDTWRISDTTLVSLACPSCQRSFASPSARLADIQESNPVRPPFVGHIQWFQKQVEDIGFEPMTSCLQSRRSSQLS